MLSEFDLIARYFTRPAPSSGRIVLGVGDDCALIAPAPGMEIAVSSDMLVEGRHFFSGADPASLGHKALAVNLSDLGAMGATPIGFTLALALPNTDPHWLAPFSEGLLALADAHDCALIGGDTTKGPLTLSVTIFGSVPPSQSLRRDAAQPGDDVWVSGALGDARLALAHDYRELVLDDASYAIAAPRLHRPSPRVALGVALRGIAHAAIDVSDGLAGDLGHILTRSGVGATIDADALPRGDALSRQSLTLQRQFSLAGGDDYELCFTALPAQRDAVVAAGHSAGIAVTRIGHIEAQAGLRIIDASGSPLSLSLSSFDHFRTP